MLQQRLEEPLQGIELENVKVKGRGKFVVLIWKKAV